jgi:glycosyltransferase involved in cell wall biosynthesis
MSADRRVLEVLSRSAGGIARHVGDIAEGLQGKEGIEIDIAAPADLPVRLPGPVVPLEIPEGLSGHRSAVEHLREMIARGGYDVVHAHGLRAAIDAARAARSGPAVAIASIHNLIRSDVSGRMRALAYRRAEPLAVKWNDHLFAPSDEIARHLRMNAGRDGAKVELLHLGVAEPPRAPRARDEVRSELGVAPDQPLLVTVARLAPQKALDVLIDACALLPHEVRLAIIGSGPCEAKLKALVHDRRLSDQVMFLGYKDEPQDQVAASDVFCLSSTWEACSLAAQEAMHLGVAVVSTDVGGMGELIEDRFSGRLVPNRDPRALAEAVREMLADPGERRRMAANAKVHLHAQFSLARMLSRLERAYRGGNCAIS